VPGTTPFCCRRTKPIGVSDSLLAALFDAQQRNVGESKQSKVVYLPISTLFHFTKDVPIGAVKSCIDHGAFSKKMSLK
jgi:hypothetical protein